MTTKSEEMEDDKHKTKKKLLGEALVFFVLGQYYYKQQSHSYARCRSYFVLNKCTTAHCTCSVSLCSNGDYFFVSYSIKI